MPLACGDDLGGIDGLFVELLLQNFSILADEEIYTARGFVFVNVDAILAGDLSSPVTPSTGTYPALGGGGFFLELARLGHPPQLGVGRFHIFPLLLRSFYFVPFIAP